MKIGGRDKNFTAGRKSKPGLNRLRDYPDKIINNRGNPGNQEESDKTLEEHYLLTKITYHEKRAVQVFRADF